MKFNILKKPILLLLLILNYSCGSKSIKNGSSSLKIKKIPLQIYFGETYTDEIEIKSTWQKGEQFAKNQEVKIGIDSRFITWDTFSNEELKFKTPFSLGSPKKVKKDEILFKNETDLLRIIIDTINFELQYKNEVLEQIGGVLSICQEKPNCTGQDYKGKLLEYENQNFAVYYEFTKKTNQIWKVFGYLGRVQDKLILVNFETKNLKDIKFKQVYFPMLLEQITKEGKHLIPDILSFREVTNLDFSNFQN